MSVKFVINKSNTFDIKTPKEFQLLLDDTGFVSRISFKEYLNTHDVYVNLTEKREPTPVIIRKIVEQWEEYTQYRVKEHEAAPEWDAKRNLKEKIGGGIFSFFDALAEYSRTPPQKDTKAKAPLEGKQIFKKETL
jgi:hypothetical protein